MKSIFGLVIAIAIGRLGFENVGLIGTMLIIAPISEELIRKYCGKGFTVLIIIIETINALGLAHYLGGIHIALLIRCIPNGMHCINTKVVKKSLLLAILIHIANNSFAVYVIPSFFG